MEERSYHSIATDLEWIIHGEYLEDYHREIQEYLDKQRRFAEYLEANYPTD